MIIRGTFVTIRVKKKDCCEICCIFAPFKRKKGTIMETIIERTPGRITVSMSTRRWNRIQKLEQAYKLARIIKHSMEQAEKAPAMTVEQAMKHLEEL